MALRRIASSVWPIYIKLNLGRDPFLPPFSHHLFPLCPIIPCQFPPFPRGLVIYLSLSSTLQLASVLLWQICLISDSTSFLVVSCGRRALTIPYLLIRRKKTTRQAQFWVHDEVRSIVLGGFIERVQLWDPPGITSMTLTDSAFPAPILSALPGTPNTPPTRSRRFHSIHTYFHITPFPMHVVCTFANGDQAPIYQMVWPFSRTLTRGTYTIPDKPFIA